jgi:hypothetical protein
VNYYLKQGGFHVPDLWMYPMQDLRHGDQERGMRRLQPAIRKMHLQEEIGEFQFLLEGGQSMVARKLFVFFLIAVFSLSLAGLGFSEGMVQDAKGTVTKIEGGKVSIMDSMGEKTIVPANSEVLTDLKVGDQVSVKDRKLVKEVGPGPSVPSSGPKK